MKQKTMLVAAGAFSIFCLSLVAYGVLTHREAGFIPVCWNNNIIEYGCEENPSFIKWSHLPVTVRVEAHTKRSADQKDGVTAANSAANVWNKQVGRDMIKIVNGPADAVLYWGRPSHDVTKQEGGHVQHYRKSDASLTAEVYISNTSTVMVRHAILIHEFGHLLGLAHDNFQASPMYHSYIDDEEAIPLYIRITDADTKLLADTYR